MDSIVCFLPDFRVQFALDVQVTGNESFVHLPHKSIEFWSNENYTRNRETRMRCHWPLGFFKIKSRQRARSCDRVQMIFSLTDFSSLIRSLFILSFELCQNDMSISFLFSIAFQQCVHRSAFCLITRQSRQTYKKLVVLVSLDFLANFPYNMRRRATRGDFMKSRIAHQT